MNLYILINYPVPGMRNTSTKYVKVLKEIIITQILIMVDYIHNYMLLLTCTFNKWIIQLITNINMYVLMNATV